ncbi:MAG: hypothetical protein JOZ08_01725, partial [Verrucomicrobia bacterium]|nr:hypothetical protein [Verrucomicrobiota bacterium]
MSKTLESADVSVGINIVTIPDGLREISTREYVARLNVYVTPNVNPASGAEKYDLINWPVVVRSLAKRLRVAVGRLQKSGEVLTVVEARFIPEVHSPVGNSLGFETQAEELWRRIFVTGGADPKDAFEKLVDAIRGAEKQLLSLSGKAADERFGAYRLYEIARVIDAINTGATATNLLRLSPELSGLFNAAVFGRLPGTPSIGFWKMFREWMIGDTLGSDPASRLLRVNANKADRKDAGERSAAKKDVVQEMQLAAKRLKGEIEGKGADDDARETNVSSSMELIRQFFLERTGEQRFWWSNSAGRQETTIPHGETFRGEIERFRECWNLDWRPIPRDESEVKKREYDNAPLSKYSGIQCAPNLAKFLGFSLDIEIPLPVLLSLCQSGEGGRSYGVIRVDYVNEGEAPSEWNVPIIADGLWTTFVYRPQTDPIAAYFGPCLKSEAAECKPSTDDCLKEGMLDLTVKLSSNTPRFALQTVDVTNAVISLDEGSKEVVSRNATGLPTGRISTGFPDLRTRGIELIDKSVESQTIKNAMRQREAMRARDNGDVQIGDAESLLQGYRVDVALAQADGTWREAGRWRPLMAKIVNFRALLRNGHYVYRDIPQQFLMLPEVLDTSPREEGHARMMSGSSTVEAPAPDKPIDPQTGKPVTVTKEQTVAYSQIVTWAGQSLGVPASSEPPPDSPANLDDRTIWPDPNTALAVDIEVNLPLAPAAHKSDLRSPPLREGRAYMFGVRLCFTNNCGVIFEEALGRYLDPSRPIVLGDDGGNPFEYRRREKIQAPDVLLPWNDRLVRDKPARCPGEEVETLVVRSGEILDTSSAQRFLTPPRISFDLSEQGGVFDQNGDKKPVGAFSSGTFRMSLDDQTGAFPVARNGTWDFPKSQNPADSKKPPTESSRGSVAVLSDIARRPEQEFYPDPLARCALARFCDVVDGVVNNIDDFGSHSPLLEFWKQTETSNHAGPILIELRKASLEEMPTLRGWIDEGEKHTLVPRHPSGFQVRVNSLRILLKPGESVYLEISSVPDAKTVLAQHENLRSVFGAMKMGLDSQRRTGKVASQDLAKIESVMQRFSGSDAERTLNNILESSPVPDLQTSRYIRLIHAVQKPLAKPSFPVAKSESVTNLRFHPAVIPFIASNDTDETKNSWYVFVNENCQKDPLQWASIPGGTTTFFVGAIKVDRPSTGKVRCDGRWREYGPDSERYDPKTATWSSVPPFQYALLFEIENISTDKTYRDKEIDLLYDEAGNTRLRQLFHVFANTKARKISLTLIATSRFTDYYPAKAGSESKGGIGPYELESSSFDDSAATIWIPATSRPTQPEIDRVIPVFHWAAATSNDRKEIS